MISSSVPPARVLLLRAPRRVSFFAGEEETTGGEGICRHDALAFSSTVFVLQPPKPKTFLYGSIRPGNGSCKPKGRKGLQTRGPSFPDRLWAAYTRGSSWIGLAHKRIGSSRCSFQCPRIPNGSSQSRTGDVRALDDREGAETGAALPQRHRRSALVPLRSPPPLGVAPRRLPRPRAEKAKIRSPPPRAEKAKIRLRWARSVPVRRRRQGSAHRAGSRRRSRRRRRRQGGVRRAGSRQARLQAVSSFLHLPPSPLPLSPFLSISLEFLFLGGPRQAGNGDRDRDRRHQRR
jgi:hypothetical protein